VAASGPAPAKPGRDDVDAWRVVGAITMLALALRWYSWERTAAVFNDGPRFLRQAQAILAGDWAGAFAEPFHPLYSAATAAVAALGVDLETAAALVSVLAGTAAVAVLYVFFRDAFGAPYDWMGTLLFAVHIRAIEFSSDVQSEGLYFLLFLGATALAWRALEKASTRYAFAAGLVASLAFWTRPEGIGVALILLVLAPVWALRNGWGLAHSLRWTGALVLAASIGVGAYVIPLQTVSGEWRLTQKKVLHAPAVDEKSRLPPLVDGGAVPQPMRTLRPRQPKRLRAAIEDLWSTTRSAARPVVLVGWSAALLAFRGRAGPRALFLLALVGAYCAVLMGLLLNAGYVSRRHVLPPLLPLFGYAVFGLTAIWRVSLGRWPVFLRVAKPAPLLVGAMLVVPFQIQPRRIDKLAERQAAEWLADQRPQATGETVAGIGGRVGYYAQRPMVDFRGFDAGELSDALQRHGVDFAVSSRSDWIEALRGDSRYEAIHETNAGGHRAFVFRRRAPQTPPSGLSN
jgi:hypothetical protein